MLTQSLPSAARVSKPNGTPPRISPRRGRCRVFRNGRPQELRRLGELFLKEFSYKRFQNPVKWVAPVGNAPPVAWASPTRPNAATRSVCLPAGTDGVRTRPAGRQIVSPHGTRGHDTVHPGRKEPHQARGEYVCKAAVFGLRGQVGSHTQLAYPSNSRNGVRVLKPVRLMPSLACHLTHAMREPHLSASGRVRTASVPAASQTDVARALARDTVARERCEVGFETASSLLLLFNIPLRATCSDASPAPVTAAALP